MLVIGPSDSRSFMINHGMEQRKSGGFIFNWIWIKKKNRLKDSKQTISNYPVRGQRNILILLPSRTFRNFFSPWVIPLDSPHNIPLRLTSPFFVWPRGGMLLGGDHCTDISERRHSSLLLNQLTSSQHGRSASDSTSWSIITKNFISRILVGIGYWRLF